MSNRSYTVLCSIMVLPADSLFLFLGNQERSSMRKFITISLFLLLSGVIAGNGNAKLNPSIDVKKYSFGLDLNDTSDIIIGHAVISLTVKQLTDSLRFDLRSVREDGKGMTVNAVSVNSGNLGRSGWTHRNNKVSIESPVSMKIGDLIAITIFYRGIPADGLLISRNKFGNRTFFADHWPDRASHYLPCIDHVNDKAAVEFIITAPVRYKVVSNGTLVEESNLPGNLRLTHWVENTPLPVKVMTFGAAEFATNLAGVASGVPVWSYVYPENRTAGFSDYALALKPIEYYSELIGQYPYPKLANVQSKTVFGGLENAGCIFYSEGSVTGTGRSEGLIAHEIAHQWFGNSVTEADWHHVWLSEGFATYLTSLYWENKEGQTRLKSDMKAARDRVLRASVQNPKPVIDTTIVNLMDLLSANSYQKGSWVLHMLRNELGNETFFSGLRLYYSRYQKRNAMTADLQKVMEEVSGKNLEEFFHQWLYVTGQPDLKIGYTYNERTSETEITVTQTQASIFRFPLEIEISGSDGSKRLKLDVTERVAKTATRSAGRPSSVIIDPEVVLLFREIK